MNIQWFPGHMTKALRMMEENVVIVDAIGYVLDARAPRSCFNPSFDKIVGNKPCVFILNKSDLADKVKLNKWEQYFKTRNIPYVTATATASAEASKISDAFAAITEPLRAKYKAKGLFKPVRCLIIGVPNCGKSTLINCLSGRKTVITGDKPGVTKGKQWVRLQSGLELLDTPGTLWPKFDSDRVASRLCFIGSIKDDVVDLYEVACMLIAELLDLYPDMLSARYKISVENKSVAEIFDAIALKRGFLLRGGEIDGERCAKAILDDFRKGKMGGITFDLPEDAE
ncbi:MAG: ribosome biogenesis GTPase YlqF [Corallococcus sp.]|nr:ribosome biogenesis GTPase YlqF [Corallococcus sp.]